MPTAPPFPPTPFPSPLPSPSFASLTQAQSGYNRSQGHFWSGASLPAQPRLTSFFDLHFQSVSKCAPSETHARANQPQQLDLLTFQPPKSPSTILPTPETDASRVPGRANGDEGRRGATPPSGSVGTPKEGEQKEGGARSRSGAD